MYGLMLRKKGAIHLYDQQKDRCKKKIIAYICELAVILKKKHLTKMKSKIQHYNIAKLFGTEVENFEFILLNFNELQSLGREINENEIDLHHKHSFYIIGWLDEGFCSLRVDKQTYKLKKNHLYLICPGQVHENNFSELEEMFRVVQ